MTRPKVRKLEPEPQAHYCSPMPRWQIALIVVGALGLGGFAAARLAHPGSTSGVGAECRRISGDRRACYTRLLTDRLASKGVADAMATLDALAHVDAEVAEHAHEYSHGVGIAAYGRTPTDIAGMWSRPL